MLFLGAKKTKVKNLNVGLLITQIGGFATEKNFVNVL